MKNAVWQTSTIFKENQKKTHYLLKGWPLFASVSSHIYSWCLSAPLRYGIPESQNWMDLKEGSLCLCPLILQVKKLRLREIKLNWFLKVIKLEERSNFSYFWYQNSSHKHGPFFTNAVSLIASDHTAQELRNSFQWASAHALPYPTLMCSWRHHPLVHICWWSR